ncbi:MAG: AI-2E family transporter [Desulfobaccales bacterium]
MDTKVYNLPVIFLAAASFVVVVAGMQAAAALINPFLLAVFLAMLLSPFLFWLQRQGVPNALAVAVILLGFLVVALILMVFVGRSVNTLTRQLPVYQERLGLIMAQLLTWLNGLGIDTSNVLIADYFSPGKVMSLMSWMLSLVRGLFTNMFLVFLTVLFILIEASGFPEKLQAAFPSPEKTLGHFKAIATSTNQYMAVKTIFSLATGVSVYIILVLIGVDFALFWGLLAFLLNFIPAIGSIIAAVPAILLALLQLGFPAALLTLLGFLFVNVLFGNFLEPRFMGRRLGLSPLVVIVSLLFWGWVLGPIGMVLSVPLTMIAKIALAANADTRWLAVLLE